MPIKKILLNNIGLKLLALVLAFITWFYIADATKVDSEKTVLHKLLFHTDYISKKVNIKPIFVGTVPKGYKLAEKDVKITPESIIIVGPSKILSERSLLFTKPIDLSEHTKNKTIDVELNSISRSIRFQKTKVQIFLPVEKTEEQP